MPEEPQVTPEIEKVLLRYLDIQREERRLAEEKDGLRQVLASHLADLRGKFWFPVIAGCPLKIRYSRDVRVEYNEELLRERLGERYVHVLKPDMAKLRRELPQVERYLAPVLPLIGSPSPDRVRAAIQKGLVTKEEFSGAFKKTVRQSIVVMRDRDEAARGGDRPW